MRGSAATGLVPGTSAGREMCPGHQRRPPASQRRLSFSRNQRSALPDGVTMTRPVASPDPRRGGRPQRRTLDPKLDVVFKMRVPGNQEVDR